MKAQKEDRFLRGRQIAYLIYEYFPVTGANDFVENYADLFTVVLRNDDDSKWDEILLSMTQIPSDDILESLYKLRIRESETLKTVLELYDLEIHQKKLGPDDHRLKTVVKRSIEQEIRNKNFGVRNGNYERNAVVKNQGTKQRVQRILGDCWQWETNGQCSKGDNCSFRHDKDERAKSTQPNLSPRSSTQQNVKNASRNRSPRGKSPSGRMSRWPCKDYLKGTCNNSFCEKWHPPECLFYKTKSGCRFGEKCSFAHRQVDEQPTKRSRKNDDKSTVAMLKKGDWQEREPVTDQCHDRPGKPGKRGDKKLGQNSSKRQSSDARQLGCVFQDMKPPKSILRKCTDMRKPIQRVKFTKAIECLDGPASKELAPIHSVKNGYKSENGCRFGEKCSYAHRQVDEQPSKRSKKNGDKGAVAILKNTRQLGCVSQDVEPPKSSSILRKSSNILKPIRCVRFTKAALRHANIRDPKSIARNDLPTR